MKSPAILNILPAVAIVLVAAACTQAEIDCDSRGDAACNAVIGRLLYNVTEPGIATPRFLYVSNNGSNTISRFRIDGVGRLTYLGDTPTPGAPWDLTVHHNGRFLYVADTTNNSVTVYSIDAFTGDLSQIANVFHGDGANTFGPYDVLVHPTGQYLYSSNANSGANGDSVSTYDLGADGIPVFRSFTSTASLQPAGLAIAPDASHIYSGLVQGNSGVGVFSVQSDGTAVYQYNVTLCGGGTNVSDIALNASGTLLFSGQIPGATSCGYRLTDPSNLVSNTPFAHNAGFLSGLKFSTRDDTFFFANNNGEVLTFVVDTASGFLSGTGTTFSSGGGNGRDLAVEVNGRFVYTLNADGTVSVFRTDETEGFIEALLQQTTAGTTPQYMAIAYYNDDH